MKAILTQPAKTAMQSGRAKTGAWLLQFTPTTAYAIDPMMGWSGMGDTLREVKLTFDSKEAALAYGKTNGLEVELQEPKPRRTKRRAYADNFKFDRKIG
jgi:hypothetical protein